MFSRSAASSPENWLGGVDEGLNNLILGLHVLDQVDDTVGVTEFVVVPGDELDESVAQLDSSLGVKDGGVGITNEVSGDDLLFGVVQNSLHWAISGLLDHRLDLGISSRLGQTAGQIDDGDVGGWDTESHTGQLTVQSWNDLTDSLGSTSGSWDDVLSSTTAITPQLTRGTIDGLLGGSGGVHSGHQTLENAEVVVDNLGQWSQAVGGTGSVRNNLHRWVVSIQVDTDDEHRGIGGWGRNDDLLGSALQVRSGRLCDG